MKLGASVLAVAALFALGCGSRPATTPTSTTTITAAEITPAEDAPKTGKPQHARALTDDEAKPSKDGRRHSGGGFSGYK